MSGEGLTDLLWRVALALAPAVRFARPDVGRTLARRREAGASIAAAFGDVGAAAGVASGAAGIESARANTQDGAPPPVIWWHGASAGELLAAAPIAAALRAHAPSRTLATHFSPSGAAMAHHLEPDWSGLPPPDTRAACDAAVAAARPAALVYSKGDVWPGLTAAAARAGVPVALVNGVVRPGSRRLGRASRALFRDTYRRLGLVAAASDDDAERLLWLGARPGVTSVAGDAAFDVALMRADAARGPGGRRDDFERRLPARPEGGVRLVAGSTWPPDEKALLDAIGGLPSNARFLVQLVVVPHEPTEARVVGLLGECRARGVPGARWSRLDDPHDLPAHGVVVFDELGTLAELYTAGDVAYVGGGLSGSGLHNVLEPAAAGVPVLFGARHDRRDAAELERAGGAVSQQTGLDSADLGALLESAVRERRGAAARAYVESRSGAAAVTAPRLLALLEPDPRAGRGIS